MSITHLSPFWRFLVDFLSFLYYNRATGSQRSVLAMKKKTALTKMHIAPSTVCYDAVAARDSNEVGLILAAVRKRNGYSLVTFSELLRHYGVDVSDKGISKWEKGYTTPSIYQLVAICHALNIKEGPSYFTKTFQEKLLDLPILATLILASLCSRFSQALLCLAGSAEMQSSPFRTRRLFFARWHLEGRVSERSL